MEFNGGVTFLKKLAPVQILAVGFAAVILTGAILLVLPISSRSGDYTSFLTALFTSTSAVCVTGLVVVDTGTYWSIFGQVVIMLLIQVGGLGFMSFATLIALLMGRKITLRNRLVMQEALNSFSLQGIVRLGKYVLISTFTIEGIGAAIMSIRFIPDYGIIKGIYFSIFHAVSAFCNAGFDIVGGFKNLMPYQESGVISITIMTLIVVGGIGFTVQSEIYGHRGFRNLSLHSRLVLVTTGLLIFAGAVLFFILEFNNPGTMRPLTMKGKILASFFASITPRTAGFNTVETTKMTTASNIITVVLMYIGASPGSTGGGIKTSTFAVIVMTVISVIRGRQDTEIGGRRISKDLVYRALSIMAVSLTLLFVDVLVLSITENGASLMELVYEATSAFGTVGLSLGFSPRLTPIGRVIILATMYIGRVGPLTLAFAFAQKRLRNISTISYPEDKVLIG